VKIRAERKIWYNKEKIKCHLKHAFSFQYYFYVFILTRPRDLKTKYWRVFLVNPNLYGDGCWLLPGSFLVLYSLLRCHLYLSEKLRPVQYFCGSVVLVFFQLPLFKLHTACLSASKRLKHSDDEGQVYFWMFEKLGAELTARAKGFVPTDFGPAYHGFDNIYRNGKRFVILEAKGGSGTLAKTQMSKTWIRNNIEKMLGDSVNGALADELMRAWKEGAVDAMVVTTKIAGDQVQDPEFVFKTFAEIGKDVF